VYVKDLVRGYRFILYYYKDRKCYFHNSDSAICDSATCDSNKCINIY